MFEMYDNKAIIIMALLVIQKLLGMFFKGQRNKKGDGKK